MTDSICGRVVFSDPLEGYYSTERCSLPPGHKRPHVSPRGTSAQLSNGEGWLVALAVVAGLGVVFVLAGVLVVFVALS